VLLTKIVFGFSKGEDDPGKLLAAAPVLESVEQIRPKLINDWWFGALKGFERVPFGPKSIMWWFNNKYVTLQILLCDIKSLTMYTSKASLCDITRVTL
jgi:hypothetical protein